MIVGCSNTTVQDPDLGPVEYPSVAVDYTLDGFEDVTEIYTGYERVVRVYADQATLDAIANDPACTVIES